MNKVFYMDLETGELLTFRQAYAKFVNEYDGGDPTNIFGMDEYFEKLVFADGSWLKFTPNGLVAF